MVQNAYFSAALVILGVHFLFNAWYALGAAVTRNRPRLALLHVASLVYGVIWENSPYHCPLTIAEKWSRARAGIPPYRGTFELHYLRLLVNPHFPNWLLAWGSVGVFLVNLAVYARRFALRRAETHRHAH